MKKLMIAAAIVCAAALSQAATVDWSVTAGKTSKLYGANGTSYMGKTAGDAFYLILDSGTYVADITAALKAGTFTGTEAGILDAVKNTDGTSISTTYGGLTQKPSTNSALLKGDGETLYDFVALIVSNDADGKANWKFSTTIENQLASTDDSKNTLPWTSSNFDSTWSKPDAIPEPTSAMLLLLGVAGLALRRRRA